MDARLKDKDWRLSHLYKIKTRFDDRLARFKPNRAQEHFRKNAHSRNITLKSRRLGFTTFETIDALDDVLFTRNYDALFIAHTKEEATKIFSEKIDLAWTNFDPNLAKLWKVDADKANALRFDFGKEKDGTHCFSSISVATSGRSGTYRRVHISELAKLYKTNPIGAKEVLTGTIPSVPHGGRIDIESTAEGDVGLFYDLFWEAWNRTEEPSDSQFKAHFYNWTWDDEEIARVPVVDVPQEFKEYQEKHNLTDQQISFYYSKWLSFSKDWSALRQEYPTTPDEAFASSGDKLFDVDAIKRAETFCITPKDKGLWKIYQEPRAGHFYAIGADPSYGVGSDNSGAVVWDFDSIRPKVVATFKHSKTSPDAFAGELRDIGEHYNDALIAVENNGIGIAVLSRLKEIYNDAKIYKTQKFDRVENREMKTLGWHTSVQTKAKMMTDLSSVLYNDEIEVPSKELLFEMRTYDREDIGGGLSIRDTIKHWDLLIAAAIGFQMKSHKQNTKEIRVITRTTYDNLNSPI